MLGSKHSAVKPVIFWSFLTLFVAVESWAFYVFIRHVEATQDYAIYLHLAAALGFGIFLGIHRKSVSIALLSILVITTNPLIGIISMILIDDKFNRESRHHYFEQAQNFAIGNPFVSGEGLVEMTDNSELIAASKDSALTRLLQSKEVSEREVAVISGMRTLDVLPLLERIAATSQGEGRVLAQAAISEMSERAAVWSANLHLLELHGKPIPENLEALSVASFIEIQKLGRSHRAFGLPDLGEITKLLTDRLARTRQPQTLRDLCTLLIYEEKFDEAEKLVKEHRDLPGFDPGTQLLRVLSARGDWIGLLRQIQETPAAHWNEMPDEVKRFWGINDHQAA